MVTAYAIQIKNKFYVVPANTKRFTRAIADKYINLPIFQELIKAHPDKLTPDILYRDMIDAKRYFKLSYEYIPDEEQKPRYYVNSKSLIGYYTPETFIVII
jgi:hypothetical protein